MSKLFFLGPMILPLSSFERELQAMTSGEALARLSECHKRHFNRSTLTNVNGPIKTLAELLEERRNERLIVDKAVQHPGERELSKNRRKKLSYCYSYHFLPRKLKSHLNRKSPRRDSESTAKEPKDGLRLTIVMTPQVTVIPAKNEAKREEQEIRRRIVCSYRQSCSKQAASKRMTEETELQFKELIDKRKKPISLELADWKQRAVDKQRVKKRNHLNFGVRVFGRLEQAQFSDLYEMLEVQKDLAEAGRPAAGEPVGGEEKKAESG